MPRRLLLAILVLAVPALAAGPTKAPAEDFAFVQVSDVHVSPHLARSGAPAPLRGAESIAWICREAAEPQAMAPFGITTSTPAFGLATGDLTEYGVIDDTWSLFEQAFKSLAYPLYVVPGNHDNTWVAMYHIMRQRYGGENYSFDRFGCHFACICSASPQEPVPTIDAKTRAWLKRDLEALEPGTPVFVALHHPPYSNELANPAEYDTLIDLLRDHNVVLMLYGHGHGVSHRNMDGIDGVMGGSTYGKNAGYAALSVQDGTLRVAYHYYRKPATGEQQSDGPGWRAVLEKPFSRSVPRRLFRIATPRAGDAVAGEQFELVLEMGAERDAPTLNKVLVRVDGNDVDADPVAGRREPTWRVRGGKLRPGWHLLSVRATAADRAYDLRTATFVAGDDTRPWAWRKEFPAAIKAGPVIADEKLIIARTDGVVTAVDRSTGEQLWAFTTGAEILGTPAWSGRVLVFGSGDGKVYALDGSAELVWTFDAGLPVYGSPLVDSDVVFIGDNGGRLRALDLDTGALRWTFARADYSIECRPCLWGDRVVFGAWDGCLYALRRTDGKLAWKTLGPKSSEGTAARYYAPADCGPLAIDDTLFVCDRGYILGTYYRDGALGKRLDKGVSAIAVDPSGRHLYCRTTDDRVSKFNAVGEKLWEKAVPAGRFPVPPTCHGDAVYVCSNRGLLSVLDAGDGSVRWQYQVTPGFYVMAPVAVDEQGTCYVAGMDGTVTAVHTAPQ
ncbi:MAG: PQQ-binding-like beta-propeller repeat protein [Phycisphaerae bacterium]